jgi:hypothetical protein
MAIWPLAIQKVGNITENAKCSNGKLVFYCISETDYVMGCTSTRTHLALPTIADAT